MSMSIVIWVEVLLNLSWMFWVGLLKVLINIILQIYVTKWVNIDCVISLFIILWGTYFYVLWILKTMLITSPWNVLNGIIVFLTFGYCISFIMCVCVYPSLICFKQMKNEKDIRWIVRSVVKESNGENNWIGGWPKAILCICNRIIWYCVTQEHKKRNEKMYKLYGKLCCKFGKLKNQWRDVLLEKLK